LGVMRMNALSWSRWMIAAGLLLAVPVPLCLAEKTGKEAATEAAPAFPAEIIDDVIVPMPSEIFLVLDKLGRPDWKSLVRAEKVSVPTNRLDTALLLGATVAEGFIAVQAQDEAMVEKLGREVLKLASALGFKDAVMPHTNSILDSAKKGLWEIVRVELDKTQKTVRDLMEERRDGDMASCVSLGGWLRGTEAVTHVVESHYTADSAELLNQPDIIRHFKKSLAKLKKIFPNLQGSQPQVPALIAGLNDVSNVIGTGDEAPSSEGVRAIRVVVAKLVKTMGQSKS
jgi:hypothetical protein